MNFTDPQILSVLISVYVTNPANTTNTANTTNPENADAAGLGCPLQSA